MKIIFAGTPEFAAIALAALHKAGHEIVLTLTQPDRPAGRGMQLHASAVKQFSMEHNIPVYQPVSLRLAGKYPLEAKQAHEVLESSDCDVMVVAAYGLILPESILQIPRFGCLNIHASLLPRWRGAAPIHRAIEAGDMETGITIMQMDKGLDTGAILSMQAIPIETDDNTATLHDKLADLGGQMIVEMLSRLSTGDVLPQPQPEIGICYANKISKEESLLDFSQAAVALERKIRALCPAPGAHGLINGEIFKFWKAETTGRPTGAQTGQFLIQDYKLLIACGDGALQILELQKPGGKRLAASEFLKGLANKTS
ncbi:methionyl-tRNA formyltransferase [Oxalobacteraceae bacterium GrIS 2.11]